MNLSMLYVYSLHFAEAKTIQFEYKVCEHSYRGIISLTLYPIVYKSSLQPCWIGLAIMET
jgi:hypothetical protein